MDLSSFTTSNNSPTRPRYPMHEYDHILHTGGKQPYTQLMIRQAPITTKLDQNCKDISMCRRRQGYRMAPSNEKSAGTVLDALFQQMMSDHGFSLMFSSNLHTDCKKDRLWLCPFSKRFPVPLFPLLEDNDRRVWIDFNFHIMLFQLRMPFPKGFRFILF